MGKPVGRRLTTGKIATYLALRKEICEKCELAVDVFNEIMFNDDYYGFQTFKDFDIENYFVIIRATGTERNLTLRVPIDRLVRPNYEDLVKGIILSEFTVT